MYLFKLWVEQTTMFSSRFIYNKCILFYWKIYYKGFFFLRERWFLDIKCDSKTFTFVILNILNYPIHMFVQSHGEKFLKFIIDLGI